jgi:magnesium transporter
MISRYTYKKLVWVDVQSPTQDEVRQLMDEFGVHPLVADELLAPTLRPKVDLYPDSIYLILHFPTISHNHDGGRDQEIDFVVGKDFLITTHYDHIDSLHEFSKIFEVGSILNKANFGNHAGYILFHIMRELYKMLDRELDHINHDFGDIEAKIFSGKERDMVTAISRVNRDLINFKQTLRPHKEVLESFEHAGVKFFGETFSFHLHALVGDYYKVSSALDGHRETLLELRRTNDSLLTTKTNETMKFLTVMAFFTFPLSLVAAIFGMHAGGTPIIDGANGFWVILSLLSAAAISMFALFKYKKWI